MAEIRGRVVSRKSTFPDINRQIIAVAELGKLDLLLSTVQGNLPMMNLVNISTALHRLAKLTAYDGHSQTKLRGHPVLAKLLAAAHGTLKKAVANNSSPSCQALSNVAWALATINYVDISLLSVVAELSHHRVAAFKPFELSSMLWAFAKFDLVMEPKWMMNRLFEASAENIASRTEQFSFRCLLMVACAFITVRHGDQGLFLRLTEAMMHSMESARCMEIVKVAWVLSITGIRQEKLLLALASNAASRLSNFKAYELSKLLCHFINCNFFDEAFLLKAGCAMQDMVLKSNQLVTLSVALARSMPHHPSAKTALLVLLPSFTAALGDLRTDELVQVVSAVEICLSEEKNAIPAKDGREVEVTTFLNAAVCQARKHLPTSSGQELADLAQAFSAVRSSLDAQILQEIAQEAISRLADISTEALLLLLQSLSAVCNIAIEPFFDEMVKRLQGMPTKEMVALSHICAEGLGLHCPPNGFSHDSLKSYCRELSRAQVPPPPGLSAICRRSVHDVRNWTSTDHHDSVYEMDSELFGGSDLFQATRAPSISYWLDETKGVDVVETVKAETLQQNTGSVHYSGQIDQLQKSEAGKNWDMFGIGGDSSSFFSVDVPAEINSSVSRFSSELPGIFGSEDGVVPAHISKFSSEPPGLSSEHTVTAQAVQEQLLLYLDRVRF